ncbi:hypothetical protein HK107_10385 [Parvularcula sp. ZS-1/3]|uniref:Uncharacterized protein n=1 Tax=Parvularcula mediterranea TaxID=2732508 RepID=A0A7Y3RMG7_9PROT|nr:hypothetical protein [Parvularcula mediterranea]NNU16729.1 hypothetical protein [Parvularcula mediterranea]
MERDLDLGDPLVRLSDDDHEANLRLLYDDDAPRLRRPINESVLVLRRPSVLFAPVAVLIAAGIPAAVLAFLTADMLPFSLEQMGIAYGAFLTLVLVAAIGLAKREQRSFALLMPSTLSMAHFGLLIAAIAGLVAAGSGIEAVPQTLAGLPGPQLDTIQLQLMKGYMVFFVLMTVAAILSVFLLRIIGFQRVVAADA